MRLHEEARLANDSVVHEEARLWAQVVGTVDRSEQEHVWKPLRTSTKTKGQDNLM